MRYSIHKQHVKETSLITCMLRFMTHQHQWASKIIVKAILYTYISTWIPYVILNKIYPDKQRGMGSYFAITSSTLWNNAQTLKTMTWLQMIGTAPRHLSWNGSTVTASDVGGVTMTHTTHFLTYVYVAQVSLLLFYKPKPEAHESTTFPVLLFICSS